MPLLVSYYASAWKKVGLIKSGWSFQVLRSSASASRGHYQLAILDSALSDVAFVPLCMDLLEQQQNIRLVIIPPENNPNHSSLGGLIPHGYLSRPFYLPDLIDIISRLLEQSNVEQRDPKPLDVTLPPWLQDPQLLPGYLERQLLDTQALAGIVGVHGTEITIRYINVI